MRTRYLALLIGLIVAMLCENTSLGQATFSTKNLRLQIDRDGVLRSLAARRSGVEYAWLSDPRPVAWVYRGNHAFPASQVELVGDRLKIYFGGTNKRQEKWNVPAGTTDGMRVDFSGTDVIATYQVSSTEDYLAFRLVDLTGIPVDRIDLLRLRVRRLPYLGRLINFAWDDDFGICLCAGNIKTNAGMRSWMEYVEMQATAEKEVVVGTTAILFGCKDPRNRFLDVMEIVERDFNMPSGEKHRRLPAYSFFWCRGVIPGNVGEYVKWAKRGGFRMVLITYTHFTKTGVGHFVWDRKRYPEGMADLKKVTDAFRRADIKLALHIHYNKADIHDPYVSPVPDDRLHTLRTFTLSKEIGDKAANISVHENPGGCPLYEGLRVLKVLKVGKELIAYDSFTTRPPFQFNGCRRGYLNTVASRHGVGDQARLLDTDMKSYIRYDQNTDIQDETAQRIARIYHETGPYDMIFFDGAEDVQSPAWYHVANAQYRVYRLLKPEPPACQAAVSSHFSWHMIPWGNPRDAMSSPHGMKDACDIFPCRSAPVAAFHFTRTTFGRVGKFGGGTEYVSPDVLEYVASRAAAWDCPFSIYLGSLNEFRANPRTDDCFDIVKIWEDARIENRLTQTQREMLRNVAPEHYVYPPHNLLGRERWAVYQKHPTEAQRRIVENRQEHHLFVNEKGDLELVAIQEIPNVANGSVKAYSFCRAAVPNKAYVLVWSVGNEVKLRLPVKSEELIVMRPFGTLVPIESEGRDTIISIRNRAYIVLKEMNRNQARKVLREAKHP